MSEPLFLPGRLEVVKFGVHLVLFGASVAACLYNAAAFLARRDRHLAINVGVYGAVACYEVPQLYHHGGSL